MSELKEKILFSPIGATDPIRKMHDGPCLHIIRHYHPSLVVLFLTQEMKQKEDQEQLYTLPIRKLDPNIQIERIDTDIENAHLYESFLQAIPDAVYKLHEQHPNAEILMNISSGTPQMTTTMVILSMQEDWCVPIQVVTPVHRSNQNNKGDDQADVETMMETNMDDDPNEENRCHELELRALRFYADRNRITSLADNYAYDAALNLAHKNRDIPKSAVNLLQHANYRKKLQSDKARVTLAKYKGISLMPFHGLEEQLVEYFLTIDLDRKTGNLSSVLLKVTPFLYEILLEYVKKDIELNLQEIAEKLSGKQWMLRRNRMQDTEPELMKFLDSYFLRNNSGKFRDSSLSPLLLLLICQYAQKMDMVKDKRKNESLLQQLQQIQDVLQMRNEVAHTIVNIDEEKFQSMTKINSEKLVSVLYRLLQLVYGDEVKKVRNAYEDINRWITEALRKLQ